MVNKNRRANERLELVKKAVEIILLITQTAACIHHFLH
jgi:hypothetical protein